jgi:hypothetical protein
MDVLGGPAYRLLEEAYAASLDPTRYDQFMQCWGAYLSERGSAGPSQRESTDRALERHFNRALTILDRLPGGEQHCAGLDALPVAAVVIDSTGAILAHNQRARAEHLPMGSYGVRRLQAP